MVKNPTLDTTKDVFVVMLEYYDYNQSYHVIQGVFASREEALRIAREQNAKLKKDSYYEWDVYSVPMNTLGEYGEKIGL